MTKLCDTKNVKQVLITGNNSYIGNYFEKWVKKLSAKYVIDKISLRKDDWKEISFSGYDVVLHVAGIAHVNANPEMESLYYEVNRDKTIEVAKKAKKDGVEQFIFISSIIVFGESNINNMNVAVTKNTSPNPIGFYGNSKLEAEYGIIPLQDDGFNVVIIRPPMIYGKDSKGNFPKLVKLAKNTPIFPSIVNKRSMLYIDNLCKFIQLMIDNEEYGIFHPQNKEYVNTTDMVKLIATTHGKVIWTTKIFNPMIRLLRKKVNVVSKIFGTFIYDKEMSNYKEEYCVSNFEQSIREIEGRDRS